MRDSAEILVDFKKKTFLESSNYLLCVVLEIKTVTTLICYMDTVQQ